MSVQHGAHPTGYHLQMIHTQYSVQLIVYLLRCASHPTMLNMQHAMQLFVCHAPCTVPHAEYGTIDTVLLLLYYYR